MGRQLRDVDLELTRTMKKIEKQAGKLKHKVRDRRRSVNKRVISIALSGRHKGSEGEQRRKKQYRELLRLSRQILNDTRRVLSEVEDLGAKKKRKLRPLTTALSEIAGRVRQVIRQAKVRVFEGITQLPTKIVSLFEPHTEIIRKGKASKPTEFGKLVQVQEAENQIITSLRGLRAKAERSRVATTRCRSTRASPWMRSHSGGCRCRLLFADSGTRGPGEGREVGGGAESQHPQRGAKENGGASLVQESAGVEKRLRRAHQRHQAASWPEPMPLPRRGRYEALGWARCNRGQPHQYW